MGEEVQHCFDKAIAEQRGAFVFTEKILGDTMSLLLLGSAVLL